MPEVTGDKATAVPALTFTGHWAGLLSLATFVVAYGIAMAAERLHLRKSVPVLLAAALIWTFTGIAYAGAH